MAVFTSVSVQDAQKFLQNFDVVPTITDIVPIREGIENSNFYIETCKGTRYILTLFEKRVRPEDVPYFAALLNFLYKTDLPVPAIIANNQGVLSGMLHGKPCVVTSFLEGSQTLAPTTGQVRQIGSFLAKLHLSSPLFPLQRANSLAFPDWQELLRLSLPRADSVKKGLTQLITTNLQQIKSLWPNVSLSSPGLPSGICHNDLFTDNVFFNNDHQLSGVFDFYFASNEYFIYDIAVTLHAWCFDNFTKPNDDLVNEFLNAYQQIRPLSTTEWEALPTMMTGAALRFISTRLYDWLHPPTIKQYTPKHPEEYILHLEWCMNHQNYWQRHH